MISHGRLKRDTFCKKEERDKRRLFRAATPEQKSILTRTQIDRWREGNRSKLNQSQLAVLEELWTMATAEMFEAATEAEARAKVAAFEARAASVFSGRARDEISPYGPCVAKKTAK